MTLRGFGAALLASATLCCACGAKTDTSSGSASAQAAEARCEHGVAPELCPKCNPALEAVYKGNGDWCPEHGMPESFCPICHPERKGRPLDEAPAKKRPVESSQKAPSNGMKVRLQSEAAVAGAGIVTVPAVKAPAKTSTRFFARVVYDATRTAEITASGGGVVRSVRVDVGSRVKAGDELASLDSADVGGDRSKLSAAYRRVQAAQDRLERLKTLEKEGIVPRNERIDAELRLDDAKTDAASLAAELGMSGATHGQGGRYALTTPIDGVVTQRTATIGRLVESKETLFQIVDPSVLWAELDVPEAVVGTISEGAEVVLTVAAVEGETFAGTVSAILPEVDPRTRTVRARVSVKNPHHRLRANMFGEAAVLGDTPPGGVTVPRSAIQTVGSTHFVFVRKEPLVFLVRHVTVPSKDGASALVVDGLEAGDEVVTTGSFLLKTETLKDSIGAGCCGDD